MSSLSQFKSSVAKAWSKIIWDGLIDAIEARLAPLEEQVGVERATVDAIIARGLTVIELQLAPVVSQAEDRLNYVEQLKVDAIAAYAVIQALADQDIGDVIQPLLVQSQQMLDDANEALADANATIANIQTIDEKDQANGYAGLDANGKLSFARLTDVPAASEGTAGVAKIATAAEITSGLATDKIVTPFGLGSRTATTDRRGLVELATPTEAATGTDVDRAVTAFTMKSVLDSQVVRADAAQAFTAPQKTQARDNIGGSTVGQAVFTAADAAAALTVLGTTAFARTILDDASGDDMFVTMGAANTLTIPGYQKLPGGIIIQWGNDVSVLNAGGDGTVAFPIVFPNMLLTVLLGCGDSYTGFTSVVSVTLSGTTASGVSFRTYPAHVGPYRLSWIAIGY